MTALAPSLDPSEVAKFSAMAAEWWNPKGKFGVLHVFNPVRLQFIKEQVTARLGRDPLERFPFEGLRFLDIGCGGGLLTEPMARLGAAITGVDPSERNIKTASVHRDEMGLEIDYRVGTAEDLAAAGEQFDVILNMEVIEHVAHPDIFLRTCAAMLAPGGLMIVATLNRTLKALALAKVGAEYILRWVPAGTHDWNQFLKPEELRAFLQGEPYDMQGPFGVAYDPLSGKWSLSPDSDINYMMTVTSK